MTVGLNVVVSKRRREKILNQTSSKSRPEPKVCRDRTYWSSYMLNGQLFATRTVSINKCCRTKPSQRCQCYRRVPRREEQECRAGGLFRMLYWVFLVTLSIFLTIIMAPNSRGNWLSRRRRMLERWDENHALLLTSIARRLMFQPVFAGVGTPPLPPNRYVLAQQARREQEHQVVAAAPQAAPQAPQAPPTRCEAAQRLTFGALLGKESETAETAETVKPDTGARRSQPKTAMPLTTDTRGHKESTKGGDKWHTNGILNSGHLDIRLFQRTIAVAKHGFLLSDLLDYNDMVDLICEIY
ncbi:hypothetical protein B0H13DRAFT_2280485 [Mycena leptocephala]|nr:hypothetical protein B0H13DRAFT_2280485 [Mycena leptocephala]